jgi:small subunit ribosomal protein S8
MTDPISDMVVRIKNASKAGKYKLTIPYSKMKESISKLLQNNGFIENYSIKDNGNIADKALEISLKYTDHKKPIILDIKTTSTPGLRIYKKVKEIKPFKSGLGIEIISTSQGIMADIECREKNIGGLTLIKIM